MIESIQFNLKDAFAHKTPHTYATQLDSVIARDGKFEFTSGLNIIVGANGSGKSTILNAIAHHMAALQTGYSVVTKSWIQQLSSGFGDNLDTPLLQVKHDGQPVLYCNPRNGISSKQGGLDPDEFYGMQCLDQFYGSRESSGEKSNRLLTPLLQWMNQRNFFPEEIPFAFNPKEKAESFLEQAGQACNIYLSPSIDKGKPTVILDEPETGLSILNQILLWKKVINNPDFLAKFQVILVSHSHECINIEHANYIELKSGYLNACRNAMSGNFDEAEIKRAAAKTYKKLDKRSVTLLKKLHRKEKVKYTASKYQDDLLRIGYITDYTERQRHNKGTRQPSRLNTTTYVSLTELGIQYLLIHEETL